MPRARPWVGYDTNIGESRPPRCHQSGPRVCEDSSTRYTRGSRRSFRSVRSAPASTFGRRARVHGTSDSAVAGSARCADALYALLGGRLLESGAMVFLMTLMFVLPSDVSTQAVPSPGDRIRIEQVNGTVFTGTLATFSAETIQLSVDPSRPDRRSREGLLQWIETYVEGTIAIPKSQIATLERQEGRRGRPGVGMIIGALVGGANAAATMPDRTNSCDMEDHLCWVGVLAPSVGHVALRVVVGVVVGGLIGSALRTENWVILPLIEVASTGQGTSASVFGFGLRFARVQRPCLKHNRGVVLKVLKPELAAVRRGRAVPRRDQDHSESCNIPTSP